MAALLPALVLLFLVSGACGLIYQVLWLRMLGLVFGVTVYSASTVWASFMAGLALGSYLGGKVGDRTKVPLIWFGAVEILVGVSALATPAGLAALQHLYASALPSLPQSFAALTTARAMMSFLVLLVPTLMMGASLPLIIRSSMFRGGTLGSRVGLLYGTNTTGAIMGTLAAGLYLIPTVGIAKTFQAAALMNVSAGVVAVLMGLALRRRSADCRRKPGSRVRGCTRSGGSAGWCAPAGAVGVHRVGLRDARTRSRLVPGHRPCGAAHGLYVCGDACGSPVRHRVRQLSRHAIHAPPMELAGAPGGRRDRDGFRGAGVAWRARARQ